MDRIANEAMGYHPESRAEFFRDVMEAIKDHLENAKGHPTATTNPNTTSQ